MREATLRDYFLGKVDASELSKDLAGTAQKTSHDVISYRMDELKDGSEMVVLPAYLIKLCEDVLSGRLEPNELEILGTCLEFSDYFTWDTDDPDGERVAETVFNWASPEINYPLTMENITKFKTFLETGQDTFD